MTKSPTQVSIIQFQKMRNFRSIKKSNFRRHCSLNNLLINFIRMADPPKSQRNFQELSLFALASTLWAVF